MKLYSNNKCLSNKRKCLTKLHLFRYKGTKHINISFSYYKLTPQHHKVVEERKKEEKKSNKVIFSLFDEGEKKNVGGGKIFFPAYGWHFVCLHHHVSSSFSR